MDGGILGPQKQAGIEKYKYDWYRDIQLKMI